MTRFLISAALGATAMAALSVPAFAQVNSVNGEVDVNGTVTAKCAVQPGGLSTFSGNIHLGPLDDPSGSGKISTALAGTTSGSPAGSQQFTVICNTGAPVVTLTATSLQNSVVPGPGYTSTVDYTAELDVGLANSTTSTTTYPTPSGPASGPGALADSISTNTDNVTVKVYALNTDGGSNSSVLTQGTYGTPGGTGGVILVTISPT